MYVSIIAYYILKVEEEISEHRFRICFCFFSTTKQHHRNITFIIQQKQQQQQQQLAQILK
jgi:hypothetical protein